MTKDFKGFLLNCFIGGEINTTQPSGGWIRNRLQLSLAGHDVEIVQAPEFINANPSDFRGESVETTEVIVRNVDSAHREDIIEKLRGLAVLLSFITCSQVVLYGWEHPISKPQGQFWSVAAKTACFRPVLNTISGRVVKEYLELVCSTYFKLEKPRKLRVAFDYFVSAEVLSLPLELKLLTMFVLFENLKATFALERHYKFEKNYYLKPSGGRWCFKSLLKEMLCNVGMNQSLDEIVDLRNEIIHSGISRMSYDEQYRIYGKCQDIAREYLLRLMGFSGAFFLYSGRGMTKKMI